MEPMACDAATPAPDTSALERRRAARRAATARCRERKRMRAEMGGDDDAAADTTAVVRYSAPVTASDPSGDTASIIADLVDERLRFYFGQQGGDEEPDDIDTAGHQVAVVDRMSDFSHTPASHVTATPPASQGSGLEKLIVMALVPLIPRLAVMVAEAIAGSAARHWGSPAPVAQPQPTTAASGPPGLSVTGAVTGTARAMYRVLRRVTAPPPQPPAPASSSNDRDNRDPARGGQEARPDAAVGASGAGSDPSPGPAGVAQGA